MVHWASTSLHQDRILIGSSVADLAHETNRPRYIIIIIFKAHQHKAAGRKTRLDIQNYGCNGNLLCYHGVVERNRISSAEPWKGVGKGMLSPGFLL